jgi:dipeptidyl aminopeptidase/acylaminoacyl peptidase
LTVRSTAGAPPEVTVLDPDAPPRAWTALNPQLIGRRDLRVQALRWEVAGVAIEGLLVTPGGGKGPWPLVVDIHGGPTLAYHHSWDLRWSETLVPAGYAVLLPNPYGGAGRGQEFGRRNLGDPAGVEFDQIVAGVAYCVAAGYADPARVAAMGASYGGYLTAWAVAKGDVFGCGVVIAGVTDLTSCRGTANNPPFYDYLCQGGPADNPALYAERSPVTWIGTHSKPALILHGQLDQCVPVGQAHELFTGLRDAGVPALLVSYPGEGHQIRAYAHVEDQRARVLSWLAEHLPRN